MLTKFAYRLFRRRQPAETGSVAVNDPTISRAGMTVSGLRPGDASRFRPSQGDRDLAAKLGTTAYDAAEQRR